MLCPLRYRARRDWGRALARHEPRRRCSFRYLRAIARARGGVRRAVDFSFVVFRAESTQRALVSREWARFAPRTRRTDAAGRSRRSSSGGGVCVRSDTTPLHHALGTVASRWWSVWPNATPHDSPRAHCYTSSSVAGVVLRRRGSSESNTARRRASQSTLSAHLPQLGRAPPTATTPQARSTGRPAPRRPLSLVSLAGERSSSACGQMWSAIRGRRLVSHLNPVRRSVGTLRKWTCAPCSRWAAGVPCGR
jgi:hypothetical protein